MPQLDPSSFPSQLFWLAVTFIILYWVMSKVALPRIGDVLQQRRQKVSNDLEKAESLKREAEAALQAYETAMAESRSNAVSLIAEAGQEIAAEAAARNEAATAEIAKQTAEAERRIADTKSKALDELKASAGDLVQAIAGKLVDVQVAKEDADKAVDAVIKGRA